METRFHMPDYTQLYNEIVAYVKEKQGKEDMVWLDYDEKDKCYALVFGIDGAYEEIIQAIKVDEYGSLSIRMEEYWYLVWDDAFIYTYQTLRNIANIIEDILEEE